jgi:radical SAM PhpK family P-methyltransferase
MSSDRLDCVTIGYYEPAFEEHERMLRQLGVGSAAYRDLQFSFVDLGDRKLTYAGLLSYAFRLANGGGSEGNDEFKSGDIPSLAAVYLTNFLRRRGLAADYVNLFSYETDKLRRLLARRPLCVAVTTTFYSLNFPVIEIVNGIKRLAEYDAGTRIVVGGPLVANHHRRYPADELLIALDDMGADAYVVESQGELTLGRYVECLRRGGDLAEIPNLVYRDAATGRLRVNPVEKEANSLESGAIDWRSFAGEGLGATLQTRTARSCAFSCSFCGYPTRAGKLTLASVDTVEGELDAMRAIGGVENVVFIDDTFNVPLPRFKELCRMMIRKRYGFRWFSYFRCSNSDQEAIELMAQSGCKGVFLGIESGSPQILLNMDKHAAVDKYREGIRLLKQHGVLVFGSFITGFPGETAATVRETAEFIKETRPDYYRAQIWYCEPGTPIYQRKDQYGIEGEGYNWRHATMDSQEAMERVEDLFLEIRESQWLPQWSFDFWIIPYLLGKGMPAGRFARFVSLANRMLQAEIEDAPSDEKKHLQSECLDAMVRDLKGWRPGAPAAAPTLAAAGASMAEPEHAVRP